MKAVSYRWGTLTKEQKTPFEQIAIEDKLRYDREGNDYKKGIFQGRSSTPQINIQNYLSPDSLALEVNEDIM
jgi:hypothetical protein